jgi:ABC-2 type transport system permease protein
MSKFLTILKWEYAQVVKKKSFIIGIFLTPAIMAVFVFLPSYFARQQSSVSESVAIIDAGGQNFGDRFVEQLKTFKLEGKDEAAFTLSKLFTVPPGDSAQLRKIEDSLRGEVNQKGLKYFLVLLPNAEMNDSNLYLVTNSSNFSTLRRFENSLSTILSTRRLEISNVNAPVDSVLNLTRRVDLAIRDTKGTSIPFEIKYFSALILVMLIYMMILTYGMMVMRSVIEEKNSRIMEVMVSSVTSFQLLMGKVIGLGAAAFTAVLIWIGLGAVMYFASGAFAIPIDPSISRLIFNPVVVVFFVLYLVSGYLFYSTIFALIGSIVNTEKEAQNYIMPITICIILPVILGISVVQDPYTPIALVMSFIPLFTPTMMMMRIVFIAPTATHYSLFSGILGESILAFIIIVLSIFGIIWLAAKIFRVGILMYGKKPTLAELVKWIKY